MSGKKERKSKLEKHQLRINLYNKGLNDREIAEILGCHKDTIFNWRKKNGLKTKTNYKPTTKKEHNQRFKLYKQGLNDREIGNKIGVSAEVIYQWRRKHGFKANFKSKLEGMNDILLNLYNQGMSDKEIASLNDISTTSVRQWRNRNNLKSKFTLVVKLSEKEQNRRLELYNQGLNDKEIGKIVKRTASAISDWRRKNNLKSNFNRNNCGGNHNNVPEHIIFEALNTGTYISEIARVFGISDTIVRYFKEKNNLRTWRYGKKCVLCGVMFSAVLKHQIKCSSCSEMKNEFYFDVKTIRREFFRLLKNNPDEAMRMKKQMVEEEGIDFTNLVLGNISPETVYETKGYAIVKENGGIIIEGRDGKPLWIKKEELKEVRKDFRNKIFTVYQFVHGNRHGKNFVIYYINPFVCIKKILERKYFSNRYSKEEIYKFCEKVFKQHKDYILNEVENKDSKYFEWNKKNKKIWEYFMGKPYEIPERKIKKPKIYKPKKEENISGGKFRKDFWSVNKDE